MEGKADADGASHGPHGFFLCVFVLAILVLLPMRLGLNWLGVDERGIAAREAQGSVWNGRLIETQFGDAAVGDVDAGLGFFPLLIGRARVATERSGTEPGTLGDFSGAMKAQAPVARLRAAVPKLKYRRS